MNRNPLRKDWFFPINEAPVLATVTHKGEARNVPVPHKKALVAADTGHIPLSNTMTDIASGNVILSGSKQPARRCCASSRNSRPSPPVGVPTTPCWDSPLPFRAISGISPVAATTRLLWKGLLPLGSTGHWHSIRRCSRRNPRIARPRHEVGALRTLPQRHGRFLPPGRPIHRHGRLPPGRRCPGHRNLRGKTPSPLLHLPPGSRRRVAESRRREKPSGGGMTARATSEHFLLHSYQTTRLTQAAPNSPLFNLSLLTNS
jgi:hypothetical protein